MTAAEVYAKLAEAIPRLDEHSWLFRYAQEAATSGDVTRIAGAWFQVDNHLTSHTFPDRSRRER